MIILSNKNIEVFIRRFNIINKIVTNHIFNTEDAHTYMKIFIYLGENYISK
jgi:hypothetical protein